MKTFDNIKEGSTLYLAEIKHDAVRVTPRTVETSKKFKDRNHITIVPLPTDKADRFTKMFPYLDDEYACDGHGNRLYTTPQKAQSWLIDKMTEEVRLAGNRYRNAQNKLTQAVSLKV